MSETVKKKRGRPPKKTEAEIKKKNKKNLLKDERFKVLFGIFLFFFTIYITIAFISFLFTWKQDMSLFDLGFFRIMALDTRPANAMGKLGAYLAKVFIYKWFGITAFGFLIIFPLWALKLFNVKLKKFSSIISKTLIVMVWTALTLAFIFGKSDFFVGGAYSYEITQWMSNLIGKFGTGFILFISALTFIFFTFENSFEWTVEFVKNLSSAGNFKQAIEKTTQKVSFFGKKEKSDKDEKSDEDTKSDDFADLFGDHVQKSDDNTEVVKEKNFIIKSDGTKVAVNKEEQNGIGFEVEKSQVEEVAEQAEELDDKIHDRNSLEVHTNEDLQGDLEQLEDYDPTKSLPHFKLPPLSLLKRHDSSKNEVSEHELLENRNKIVETLKNYKIEIKKIKATVGPTVTLYEIIPAPGVRISKIKNLEDDIALSLAALGIRIIAPMPGRGTIGIEVPNKNPAIVSMRSVLSSLKFQKSKYELPIALGKTISNETYVFDLTKMPHLLIAGATGQGKSVGLNAIIASILYKKHPSLVKFVLIDPKKVELVIYEKIEKHYLAKLPGEEEAIVTDNRKVINTLNSLNIEMDNRYQLLKDARVRNIKEYNDKFIKRKLNPNKGHRFLPYIVLVIDEFADLIMTAGKEVELPLARLAQLARAIGIHLIVATQRPSTNIITGVIKANFPARIAFRVASMIDSRTILDTPGANQLIGRGDMLISRGSDIIRLQCAFIDTPEINDIVDYIGDQMGFMDSYELPEPQTEEDAGPGAVDLSKRDALFDDAAKIIVMNQQGSTSLIQRKLSIGYNRAGRIMDQLEAAGIVGPAQGSKPRDVYISEVDTLIELLNSLNAGNNNIF